MSWSLQVLSKINIQAAKTMQGMMTMSDAPVALALPHGQVSFPAFLPDATFGVVRSLDSTDLLNCNVPAVVMNSFHLMQRPGSSVVGALGGLHKMAAWPKPIVTDSGGFQAYSLIQQNPKWGSMSDNGIVLHREGSQKKTILSPEKAIQLQLRFDTDIAICLDECTHVDAPFEVQEISTERTIKWARRCKDEFENVISRRKDPGRTRPLLFAVVQGGGFRELRKRCANALLEIGFDGYGYGGWPLDSQNNLLGEMLAYTRDLIPEAYPMHALGVGHPKNIVECARLGYQMFDSSMPTRDARHGRLYTLVGDPSDMSTKHKNGWFSFVYINDPKHVRSDRPITAGCMCPCCTLYSLGYLHHLFKLGDGLFSRLATMHNLSFISQLMVTLGASSSANL
jgi:queuine tRNA-ribosyltransferase